MALIAGRINKLDPDPIPKCQSFSFARHDHPHLHHARSSSEPVAAKEEALFRFDQPNHGWDYMPDTVTKHDDIQEVYEGNDSRSRVSKLQKLQPKKVTTFTYDNVYSPEKQCSYLFGSVTAREINFSITSSEDIRAICSVVLGILVVLPHVSLPHNVVKPKSLIAYRPLYVVLLTAVLIVAARLAPFAQMRKEGKETKVEDDEHHLGGAVKMLELGLVLHQTIRAFLMDCSLLYLVVVVCGLSLV